MKKIITFFIIIIHVVPLLSYGQFNKNLEGEIIWSYYNRFHERDTTFFKTIKYGINGQDTIINGNTYQKIFSSGDSIFDFNHSSYYGVIREDSNERWYTFLENDTIERIIYDWDIALYDTIIIYDILDSQYRTMFIEYIDSDLSGKAAYLKRFALRDISGSGKFTWWLDGVGEYYGFLTSLVSDINSSNAQNIMCLQKNNVYTYNPSGTCFRNDYYLEINENYVNDFIVYPNPIEQGDFLMIEFSSQDDYTIILSDLYGRSVQNFEVNQNKQIKLRIMSKPGVYILFIKEKSNNNTLFKKITIL
ncbi:MAG: T9SS type A sorting domain-containing protein [Bacteroidetes bacterium]|nr:T9SS type A sorting domain-containing protein [Bacteroidota bacterium]